MKQYKSFSDLKNIAKDKLTGKYGNAMMVSTLMPLSFCFVVLFPLAMLTLIPFIIISEIGDLDDASVVVFLLLCYLALIFGGILTSMFRLGITLFFLKTACKQHGKLSDLFFGFIWQLKKSFIYSVISSLMIHVIMLPFEFFLLAIIAGVRTTLTITAVIISFILGMLIYLPLKLSLSQYYFLLLDFPKQKASELLKMSMHIMSGHKWRLLQLRLSFLPLQLLSVLSAGVGFLWVIPYQKMTYTLFFLDLMAPEVKKDTPSAEGQKMQLVQEQMSEAQELQPMQEQMSWGPLWRIKLRF